MRVAVGGGTVRVTVGGRAVRVTVGGRAVRVTVGGGTVRVAVAVRVIVAVRVAVRVAVGGRSVGVPVGVRVPVGGRGVRVHVGVRVAVGDRGVAVGGIGVRVSVGRAVRVGVCVGGRVQVGSSVAVGRGGSGVSVGGSASVGGGSVTVGGGGVTVGERRRIGGNGDGRYRRRHGRGRRPARPAGAGLRGSAPAKERRRVGPAARVVSEAHENRGRGRARLGLPGYDPNWISASTKRFRAASVSGTRPALCSASASRTRDSERSSGWDRRPKLAIRSLSAASRYRLFWNCTRPSWS